MNNKQVIAVFLLGILLLLAAFWAGLKVTRGDGESAPPAAAEATNATAPAEAPAPEGRRYLVRVGGSFGTFEQANQLTMELRRKYKSAYTQRPAGSDTLYRVNIGPYTSRADAEQVMNELAQEGHRGLMIVPE